MSESMYQKIVVMIICVMHLLIKLLDQIEKSKIFKQMIKKLINKLMPLLEDSVDTVFIKGKREQGNYDDAVIQLEYNSELIKRVVLLIMSTNPIHFVQLNNDLNMVFAKYGVDNKVRDEIFKELE